MAELRFALVGCGRIATSHVAAIARSPRSQLVGVCDVAAEPGRALAADAGVPWFADYDAMIEQARPDVVGILTPSGMHAADALAVIRRHGVHVVIEKPPALSLTDLEALADAAAMAGVRVFPVYQNRYNTAVRFVRRGIDEGILGRPVVGAVRVRWCRTQSYFDQSVWRGTWALDGGALTNQGIHFVDLLTHLMGEPVEVAAATATQLVDVEVEDTAVGIVRFASDALATIEVTTAARPDDLGASVSILAEHGAAELTGIAANRLATWTLDPSACERWSEDFANAYGSGHAPFYEDVVSDLLDGIPHPISFDEGARAVRLINAVYAASEQGRWVRLEDRPASARLGRDDPALSARYRSQPLERGSS